MAIENRNQVLCARSADFAEGLRAALRQAPHVIILGEARDRDTLDAALTAAPDAPARRGLAAQQPAWPDPLALAAATSTPSARKCGTGSQPTSPLR